MTGTDLKALDIQIDALHFEITHLNLNAFERLEKLKKLTQHFDEQNKILDTLIQNHKQHGNCNN